MPFIQATSAPREAGDGALALHPKIFQKANLHINLRTNFYHMGRRNLKVFGGITC